MKLALLGDIALFGRMSVNTNPKLYEYFMDIADYLSHFDYVVGNLETPFSVVKKKHGAKSAFICSDVENVRTLKQLHIDAVCLANNHMFDFGSEGYETTKKVLKENCIDFFGTEGKELRIERDGCVLVFNGYCCYTSGPLKCVPFGEYGVNAYNLRTVEERIKRNEERGALNIVSVHAGLEHVNYPSIEHISAARKLAEKVDYVYYGHHPHVIQGAEKYKGSIIAYSLGNFCFDDIYTKASGNKPLITLTENNRHGAILELTIEKNRVINWSETVVHIEKGNKMKLVETYAPLNDYNNAITSCELDVQSYKAKRKAILDARITERKKSRNLIWYLKRLKPMYFQILMNAKKNTKEYNNNVLKYISK